MERLERRLGLLSALPVGILHLLSFVMPLLLVAGFAMMPQKVSNWRICRISRLSR